MAIRVSQVLDYFSEPYLVKWKLGNKDWQKVSEEALRVGTLVDKMVQDSINGVGYEVVGGTPEAKAMDAWQKFREDRPDVIERMAKHKSNMQRELVLGDLVGHPDFILDNEVIDLKTSKQVSKSHWMQTAQYYHMANLQTRGTGCDDISMIGAKISILRLDKLTGEYEYKTLEEPFISFWQRKFQARYEAFCEDSEWAEIERKRLSKEVLG